uniref:dTDP-glucose 4,6-dehydratase n=1 Tax=Thermofilum adornatum TaxID=1365176 RepID=A0A7C1GA83_9CREN
MRLLVTGGAGFMGSNFVHYIYASRPDAEILVYDKFTYAGRIENLKELDTSRVKIVKGDILDQEEFTETIKAFQPDYVVHFAAETHVDRSIKDPSTFIDVNVKGVYTILEALRRHDGPKLIHISTDEVYGDISGEPVTEEAPFKPSSPYSASKASGDLLCQAYWRTYSLPVRIVRPSNNYGPRQFPEKLIPKTILRALNNLPIPVYGDGSQERDWLYVEDFSRGVETIILRGRDGEAYNLPGLNPKTNLQVIRDILTLLDKPHSLITFVPDRPGHDKRYAMRGDKILNLGWKPQTPWIDGLRKTIEWYKANEWWWRPLLGDEFFAKDTPWGGTR